MKVAIWLAGAHQPRQEHLATIKQFAVKRNIPIEGTFMSRDEQTLTVLMERSDKTLLFDRNGYALNYNPAFDNPTCGNNVVVTIGQLDTLSYIPRDSALQIASEAQSWFHFGTSDSVDIQAFKPYDYLMVVYWNTYSGKSNHEKRIASLFKAASENTKVRIKPILVNQDLRFGIDEQKMLEYTRKKYPGVKAEIKN
jgi:hypothetical protein